MKSPEMLLRCASLGNLGDEAYSWGNARANVVFRRDRFIVYVSTTANIDADPDARDLTGSQRTERTRSEMKKLSKQFAKDVVDAIDTP